MSAVHPSPPSSFTLEAGSQRTSEAAEGPVGAPAVARSLAFVVRGGAPSGPKAARALSVELERRYDAAVGAELRGPRLLFLAVTTIIYAFGIWVGDPGIFWYHAVSLGASVGGGVALWAAAPAWSETVAPLAVLGQLVGLDLKYTGVAAREDLRDASILLGVLPFIFVAALAPRLTRVAPMLVAHAAYAAYILVVASAPMGPSVAALTVSIVVWTAMYRWLTERWARQRVILQWRLELAHEERSTALALAQQQAATLDTEMHRFEGAVAYICHELRNPLHGLLGALEALREGALSLDAVRTELASMHDGVLVMCAVTNDLLDMELLRSGKLLVKRAATVVRAAVGACVEQVRPASAVPLSVLVAPGVPSKIMTDGARLRQILLNGLTNAVKYASATATGIAVSVVVNEGTITFTVADDGAGLPEGIDQAALFQDFNAISHLSGSAGVHKRRKVQSTGLGLPICNRLASALGGTLSVSNRGGSVPGVAFCLQLPLELPPVGPAGMTSGGSFAEARGFGGCHVLVVDDSATNRRIAERSLRGLGCTCVLAEDGDEVPDAIAREAFDVILMDVRMARVNGDAACVALRASGYTGVVVAVTGNATAADAVEHARVGFNATLGKPFGAAELRGCLAELKARGAIRVE